MGGILCQFGQYENTGYTPRPWVSGGNLESVRDRNNQKFYKGEIYLVGGDDGRQTYYPVIDRALGKPSTVDPKLPVLKWKPFELGGNTVCRKSHSLVTYQNKIYVIGGADGRTQLNSISCIDPELQFCNFNLISELTSPRLDHSSEQIDGNVFVIGGNDGRKWLNTIEKYDILSGLGTRVGTMRVAHQNHASVVLNDGLYVLGGDNGQQHLDVVERFDTNTGKMYAAASMKVRRRYFAATKEDDYTMYAVGGDSGNIVGAQVERYDTRVGKWDPISPMHTKRAQHTAVSISGSKEVIVMGGYDDSHHRTATVEIYDVRKNLWTFSDPLSCPRGGHSAIVL